LSASRQAAQQQQADQQVLVDGLHQQLHDTTSQLNTTIVNCDRLTTSVTQQSERANELQRKLEHAESQIKNKVRFFSYHRRIDDTLHTLTRLFREPHSVR